MLDVLNLKDDERTLKLFKPLKYILICMFISNPLHTFKNHLWAWFIKVFNLMNKFNVNNIGILWYMYLFCQSYNSI